MPAKTLLNGRVLMALVMFLIFSTMVGIALGYPAQARFMPLVVGIPGIGLTLIELVREIFRAVRQKAEPELPERLPEGVIHVIEQTPADRATTGAPQHDPRGAAKREWILLAYFTGLIGGLLLFGFWVTVPVFVVVFLKEREKASWVLSVGLAFCAVAVLYFVFYRTLGIDLHHGFLTETLQDLLFPDM